MSSENDFGPKLNPGIDFVPFDFFSTHANAILLLAENPRIQIKELGLKLNFHPRRTQMLINELRDSGALRIHKIKGPGVGRGGQGGKNSYQLNLEFQIQTAVGRRVSIAQLLQIIYPELLENQDNIAE